MSKQIVIDYEEYLELEKAKEILEAATIKNYNISYIDDEKSNTRMKCIECEELFDYLCSNENKYSNDIKVVEIRKY